MKHPAPNPAGTAAAHWEAAREGRLALPYCTPCRRFQWPVRASCLQCGGKLEWREASGQGRIAAYSIVRRAVNRELEPDAPYAIAFIELVEGGRLFANVVGSNPEALRVGLAVRCRFEPALDSTLSVPVFELTGTTA